MESEQFLNQKRTRGQLLVATLGAVGLTVLASKLDRAAQAVNYGAYETRPKPYQPGDGAQSFYWMGAKVPLNGRLNSFDEADIAQYGREYAYATAVNYKGESRGPLGDFLEASNREAARIYGENWAGRCKGASVASAFCPIIEGDKTAFGVTMSFIDRMLLAPVYFSYGREMGRWNNLTAENNEAMLTRQAELASQGIQTCAIGNTGRFRGFPDQQWMGLIIGRDPVTGDVLIRDFAEWPELLASNGRKMTKSLYVPGDVLSEGTLIDPFNPQEGSEALYKYVIHRDEAAVFLDMADAIPK